LNAVNAQARRIETADQASVSALLLRPLQARACYIFAHGAGAGMTHPSMETIAAGLAERGIATLRYQFPIWRRPASGPIAGGCACHGARRVARPRDAALDCRWSRAANHSADA